MDPRAERTRKRVLESASGLLMAEGIDAVTHSRVAEVSGVGRRTVYRHWPDRRSLLHATLSLTRAPETECDDDLRTGIRSHLIALDTALTGGPLAYIVAALTERAEHDPSFESLRSELVRSGCAPLERRIRAAVNRNELPADLDLDAAVEALEGPILHRGMLRRQPTRPDQIEELIDRFMHAPPQRPAGQ